MSWSIYAVGTTQALKPYIAELKPHMEVDRLAFERAKQIILDELERVTSNGASIEANGHAGRTSRLIVNDQPLIVSE